MEKRVAEVNPAALAARVGAARSGAMAEPPSVRAERLAEALRANLRRRKAQARALADVPAEAAAPASSRADEQS